MLRDGPSLGAAEFAGTMFLFPAAAGDSALQADNGYWSPALVR